MDNEFLNDSDDEYPKDIRVWRLAKRYIRDWENPIEFFEDVPFQKRYRFSKGAVVDILLPLVNARLRKLNNHGLPVSSLIQLLITLRFYATSSFQVCILCSNTMLNKHICLIFISFVYCIH